MTAQPETPSPKMPEHHSTDKARPTKEDKIDAQMEDSFPASDPPSFSGGNHTIVLDAEKKVKDGKAPEPRTY